jgi:energy-coupling factor transporter ATP-binding protein EcfA2
MSPRLPTLDPGTRAVIAGRTGSGKTSLARFLVEQRNPTFQHFVIFNPKHTAGYKALPDAIVMQKWDAKKFDKNIREHRFVILNFSPLENNFDFMDAVLYYIHETYENIGVLVDELYPLHNHGRAGNGLIGLLTRGRERKQTFLGLTQRPKWISLFVFSESDYIVSMALNRKQDRQTLVEATGDERFLKSLDKYYWRWYTVDADSSQLWNPVPLS